MGVRGCRRRAGGRGKAERALQPQSEQERRMLAAHPQSLGITKAENYKTKYKEGEAAHG